VLDSKLRTPRTSRILQTISQAPVLIFCGPHAPEGRRRRLEAQGAEVIAVPNESNGLDLQVVLRELGARGVLGVLVEGGSKVHWSFVSAGLIDKFYFIIAPLVLGGKLAVPSVGGRGYATIEEAARFKTRRSFHAGPDLVLETYPLNSRSVLSPWLSSETPPSGGRGSTRSSRPK